MVDAESNQTTQPRLEPGRLYFVQLLNSAGVKAPARFCARFLHQQLHRASDNSDQLIRQFSFRPQGAGDSSGEIALEDSSFHAEPLTLPSADIIHVDFTRQSSNAGGHQMGHR
jgi:hypothetical protein